MKNDMGIQQGWQCPVCKRVYSPTTPMCMYCGNYENINIEADTDVEAVVDAFGNEFERRKNAQGDV